MANVKTKETKMNVMRKKSLWSELKRGSKGLCYYQERNKWKSS